MVHLVKKKIKGRVYLYLQETARINGKSRRIWQKYLGPEHKIKDQALFSSSPEMSITHLDYGLPVSLLRIAQRLQLVRIIDKCVSKRDQGLSVGHYILITALNRCIHPSSKTQLEKWFHKTILPDKFPPLETYLDAKAYSNHFSYLTPEVIEQIETLLHKRLISEFQIDMNLLFYDPTNFFTYINPKPEQILPKHGHSKENRFTLNLVGLSLFCTNDGGIPLLHRLYPGNVQDAPLFRDELIRVHHRIKNLGLKAQEIILVFDKGNLSVDAFQQIDETGFQFVASIRPSTQKEFHNLTCTDFSLQTLPNGKKIGVKEYSRSLYGRDRRLLVIYNPRIAIWHGKNLEKKLVQMVREVKDFFKDRLNKRKWKDPGAVLKKIETILKTKLHQSLVDYSVSGEEGNVSYTIEIARSRLDQHISRLGKSYLFSNQPNMTILELVWVYRQQYTVERAFKYIKSPDLLRVRPVYHHTDASLRGHVFSCVVGLLLLLLLVREVQQHLPEMSIWDLVGALAEVRLAVVNVSGSQRTIKKFMEMPKNSRKLCEVLNLGI